MAGHSGKRKHPYTVLSKWNNELAFWRTPNPETPSTGYNVQAYEEILQRWMSETRDLKRLQANIGKN
jgi:hypothetical protein